MEINKEKVQKLAKLARLMFTEQETKRMQVDLKKILTFINKLDEVNNKSKSRNGFARELAGELIDGTYNES